MDFSTPVFPSFTISQSLLNLISMGLVMPSNHLVLCHPLMSFPASGGFPVSWLFASSGQNIGTSASSSVLSMNIQDWFPLGLTYLISLQSKGLSRVFSNTTVQKHQFFGAQPSLWSNSHIRTRLLEKNIALTLRTFVGEVMSLLFNMMCRFDIAFLPRNKCLFSWLQSPTAVILDPKKIKSVTVPMFCPSICYDIMGWDAMIFIFIFWMLSFKPAFSLSSFTFIKRFFSSSVLSAVRVVSSTYLRLLMFLLAFLISACASSSLAFHIMYSAFKLSK